MPTNLFVTLQVLAVLAVLTGVALLLPWGWALVVDGLLVLVFSVALEAARLRAVAAVKARKGATKTGGE